MERKAMCSNNENFEARVERDLWSSLLHAEGVRCDWNGESDLTEEQFSVEENPNAKISYPWDSTDPSTEEFFESLEQSFSLDNAYSEAEISARSGAFFDRVNHLWGAATLQDSLIERFASRVPQALLGAIAMRAQQVLSTSQSLANQLVQCVEDVLPNLAVDDLCVIARPLANAMRDGETGNPVDAALAKVRSVAWEELSEIEQARLSLVVARYALAELDRAE
jgi:hypothetical protein